MMLPPARIALPLVLAGAGILPARAQQLIGYVNTRDAEVTGASDTLDGQAVLSGSVSVTAKDHTAPILLGRGGTVQVCQTSALHITESREVAVAAPLLFSLDRGAIEIQTNGTPNDAIMTPDLRFTVRNAGPLDLRLRVARNGDTCVENRGPGAPTLAVSDPFGESMYEVAPGQHILFEHGSLHEVVDRESSPCGCPEPQGMSMGDALLASGGGKTIVPVKPAAAPAAAAAAFAVPAAPVSSAPAAAAPAPNQDVQAAEEAAARAAIQAANQHPFPAAISEGLAPAAQVSPAAPGEVHTQVAERLSYNAPAPAAPTASANVQPAAQTSPAQTGTEAASAPAPAKAPRQKKTRSAKGSKSSPAAGQPDATVAQASAPPADVHPAAASAPTATPPAPPANDLAHVVGRFFKRLFGRG